MLLGKITFLIAALVAIAPPARRATTSSAAQADALDLAGLFNGIPGTFVLYDQDARKWSRYNTARARQRFSPKSTFKIPNALLGVESGTIRDASYVIKYDPKKNPPQPEWNRPPFSEWPKNQTLRSAIEYSVVWYFQELARRVGPVRMQEFLDRFAYGNRRIGPAIDQFWLDGSLQISADEQVAFLRRFYDGQIASARSTAIVKDCLVLERGPGYTLSGKTGGGSISQTAYIGWLVGYVERPDDRYFYALNIEGPSDAAIAAKRIELGRAVLEELAILPGRAR